MANNTNALESFAALGDPTRRAIFERLAVRPSAVGDLARGLPVSRPAVSQHLRVLKEAGLVKRRRTERAGSIASTRAASPRCAPGSMPNGLRRSTPSRISPTNRPTWRRRMSIAPIVQSIEVKAAPPRAFDLFASPDGTLVAAGQDPGQGPTSPSWSNPGPAGDGSSATRTATKRLGARSWPGSRRRACSWPGSSIASGATTRIS